MINHYSPLLAIYNPIIIPFIHMAFRVQQSPKMGADHLGVAQRSLGRLCHLHVARAAERTSTFRHGGKRRKWGETMGKTGEKPCKGEQNSVFFLNQLELSLIRFESPRWWIHGSASFFCMSFGVKSTSKPSLGETYNSNMLK